MKLKNATKWIKVKNECARRNSSQKKKEREKEKKKTECMHACMSVCILRSPNEQIVFNKYLLVSQGAKQRQTEQGESERALDNGELEAWDGAVSCGQVNLTTAWIQIHIQIQTPTN